MTAPIIDRDATFEKAARIIAINSGPLGTHYLDHAQNAARAVLPSIADDLLAPIEALHYVVPESYQVIEFDPEVGMTQRRAVMCACGAESCPTAQAVAAIREAVRA